MTCREMVDFLMAYLDGELPDDQRARFDAHLAACPPCVTYLETYRETVALGKAVCQRDEDPTPDDVPEALVQAILAARTDAG